MPRTARLRAVRGGALRSIEVGAEWPPRRSHVARPTRRTGPPDHDAVTHGNELLRDPYPRTAPRGSRPPANVLRKSRRAPDPARRPGPRRRVDRRPPVRGLPRVADVLHRQRGADGRAVGGGRPDLPPRPGREPLVLPAHQAPQILTLLRHLLPEVELVRGVPAAARRTRDRLVVLDVPGGDPGVPAPPPAASPGPPPPPRR